MKYVIGIDGGGTKTLAYLGNLKGEIIATTSSGPSNYHSIGINRTKQSLTQIVKTLCEYKDINIEDLEIVSLGLAGVDRPDDKEIVTKIIESIVPKSKIMLHNDVVSELVGANGKGYGIITISGTGSISYGIDSKGKSVRSGGWGHIVGDEGSGYDIGRKALVSILRAYDKRDKETVLTEKVLDFLNLKSVNDIIGYVYNKDITREHIAKIAPIVLSGANENDIASKNILNEAVDSLVEITETVINQLEFENTISLTYGGGILKKNKYVQNRFIEAIKMKIDKVNVTQPQFDGAIGSLLIAWDQLNISYKKEELKEQLRKL